MQDLNHVMDENGLFVLDVANNDLVPIEGMEAAILASLFTNIRIDEPDVKFPLDRGGWFGNVLTPNRQIGSKLWVVENAQVTSGLMGKVKEYAQRSFDWMIIDNVSRSVTTSVSIKGQDVAVNVKIVGRNGQPSTDFTPLWLRTKKRNYTYG